MNRKQQMVDWLFEQDACISGTEWATSHCSSLEEMWDKLIDECRGDWFRWVVARSGLWSKVILVTDFDLSVRETVVRGQGHVYKPLNPWRKDGPT